MEQLIVDFTKCQQDVESLAALKDRADADLAQCSSDLSSVREELLSEKASNEEQLS
jgi:hypothetical protein